MTFLRPRLVRPGPAARQLCKVFSVRTYALPPRIADASASGGRRKDRDKSQGTGQAAADVSKLGARIQATQPAAPGQIRFLSHLLPFCMVYSETPEKLPMRRLVQFPKGHSTPGRDRNDCQGTGIAVVCLTAWHAHQVLSGCKMRTRCNAWRVRVLIQAGRCVPRRVTSWLSYEACARFVSIVMIRCTTRNGSV